MSSSIPHIPPNTIALKVFRFHQGRDYLPYYEKIDFPYKQSSTLSELCEFLTRNLRDLGLDEVCLRINGVSVLEDLSISELVGEFGNAWILSPLCEKFALKDFVLDFSVYDERYAEFFAQMPFITKEHKSELRGFLKYNFLSALCECEDFIDEYLGDGFFLYVVHLIELYPTHKKELLDFICNARSGILNFVSLDRAMYPFGWHNSKPFFTIIKEHFAKECSSAN